MGDAGAGWPGAAAHLSPHHRLVPHLVSRRWPRDCLRFPARGRDCLWVRRDRRGATPCGNGRRRRRRRWSPDEQWLAHLGKGGWVGPEGRRGSAPLPTGSHGPNAPRECHDGRSVYYSVISGPREDRDLWRLPWRWRDLPAHQARGAAWSARILLAAHARYLYAIWSEDDGDIWVICRHERRG